MPKHTCPECLRSFKYPDALAGEIVKCPACKKAVKLLGRLEPLDQSSSGSTETRPASFEIKPKKESNKSTSVTSSSPSLRSRIPINFSSDTWGFVETCDWFVKIIRIGNWIAAAISILIALKAAADHSYSEFAFSFVGVLAVSPIIIFLTFIATEFEVLTIRFMSEVILSLIHI